MRAASPPPVGTKVAPDAAAAPEPGRAWEHGARRKPRPDSISVTRQNGSPRRGTAPRRGSGASGDQTSVVGGGPVRGGGRRDAAGGVPAVRPVVARAPRRRCAGARHARPAGPGRVRAGCAVRGCVLRTAAGLTGLHLSVLPWLLLAGA